MRPHRNLWFALIGFASLSATATAQQPRSLVAEQLAGLQSDDQRLLSGIADAAARDQALASDRQTSLSSMRGWEQSIDARLQQGTTRGNPELVAEWQQAELMLSALDRSMSALTRLSIDIAQTVALGNYLTHAVKGADSLQGATDQEHAELLALAQSIDGSDAQVTALAAKINRDVDQQSAMLDAAHRRLTLLRHAIDAGVPLATQ